MTRSDLRRARRAFVLVAVLVPFVVTAVVLPLLLGLLALVPDPVATHWSPAGPDGFAPASAYVWMLLGLGLGLPVVLSITVLLGTRTSWGSTGRFLGAVAVWLAGFFAVAMTGSLWIQRGLADATDAPSVLPVLLVGLGVGMILGIAGWFVQPAVRVVPERDAAAAADAPAEARSPVLRPGERIGWVGTATIARGGVVVLALLLSVQVGVTLILLVTGVPAWGIAAAITVFVAVAVASSLTFRVRIGIGGLRVRSLLGWPGVALPLDRIAGVEVVQVSPMAEFGGWGWRFGLDGRRGAVLRAGEALQVTATDGRVYVATVDGADDAAAALRALRASGQA